MSGKTQRGNFIGHDGFVWWIGVVEDRMDPLNLGRCRVRIQGLHTSTKTSIATESLPWAQPLFSINGSMSTPSTLKEGDFVMGFFMDGNGTQFPVIMGMFHGIPEDIPDREKGFHDPRTDEQLKTAPRKVTSINYKTDGTGAEITQPTSASSYPNRLNEPTTSRLSRNEGISDTIVQGKLNSVVTVIDAKGGNWIEPKTPFNTKYPYNQVVSTESGHYFELDDTFGSERIHLYHRSGTFTETHPDGSQVEKIVKDKYTIIMKNDKVCIMGDCSITVQGGAKIYVVGDCNMKVDGNYDLKVGKNMTTTVTGNMTTSVTGSIKQSSNKSETSLTGSKINLN
jgi:hypothetical protein